MTSVKASTRASFAVAATLLALAAAPVRAGELSAAVGVFMLQENGLDFHIAYRPAASRWQLGLRALHYSEDFEFAGTALTKTTTSKFGPTINYLFRPESTGSWYLGASLLQWTQKEQSLRTGTSGKQSTLAPFFGGGYQGKLGRSFYYNFGLFLSPANLTTQTADSTEESTGADVQLQLGFAF